jgi:hypothetical protein
MESLLHRIPFPELLAALAVAVHAFFAWGHMHGQVSVLDEGLYLYKGWLFATGRYAPFEDFGLLTNHMPLSFLIPGWIQTVFGPGIRTGRTMAFTLGLLMLVGLWILGRRIAGRWWAALPLWFVALNPFLTKIYAQAISQVLVAAILVWALVFTLDSKRPLWQIVIGSALAATCALVRINLMPLPLLLVPWVFWQHGRRSGVASLLAASVVIVLGHAIFWPEILKLWANWVPSELTPFLNAWREPLDSVPIWDPPYGLDTRLSVFRNGLGRHLGAVLGILAGGLIWLRLPPSRKWDGTSRTWILLTLLFLVLTIEHAWAALGNNYCVYCFQTYLAFFSPIGLLVAILAIKRWPPQIPRTYTLAVLTAILGVGVALGGRDFDNMAQVIFSTQAPRMKQLRLLPGTSPISAMLDLKFGISSELGSQIISIILLIWAIAVLCFLILIAYRLARAVFNHPLPNWPMPWLFSLLVSWTLINGLVRGNRFRTYDCGGDVISAVEAAGGRLAEAVDTGSNAYWQGSLSPVPLLYASGIEVYPPQLNRVYSYRLSDFDDDLLRLGLWNAALDEQWLEEADYLLVLEEYHDPVIADALRRFEFEERDPTLPTDPCRPETAIRIYRRIQ